MALRSIPPKTSTGPGRRVYRPNRPAISPTVYTRKIKDLSKDIRKVYGKPTVQRKPREWKYVTKPFFARIKEPLVDVFKEAKEIQIVVDLGGFAKDEVSFGLKNGKYTICGKHDQQEFKEEIDLPKGADLNNVVESFKNNILSLILPKKDKQKPKKRQGKKYDGKA